MDLYCLLNQLDDYAKSREPYNGPPTRNTVRIMKTKDFFMNSLGEAHTKRLEIDMQYLIFHQSEILRDLEEYWQTTHSRNQ